MLAVDDNPIAIGQQAAAGTGHPVPDDSGPLIARRRKQPTYSVHARQHKGRASTRRLAAPGIPTKL